jgi:hypothetical protein
MVNILKGLIHKIIIPAILRLEIPSYSIKNILQITRSSAIIDALITLGVNEHK